MDILANGGARGEQCQFQGKEDSHQSTCDARVTEIDYHLLCLEQQVVLVRLCTRHNRLNSHMYHKLKVAPSQTCTCGQEDQTTQHVLQRGPLHKVTRENVWPVSTPLMTKLYGCKQEPEKTTSFISRELIV